MVADVVDPLQLDATTTTGNANTAPGAPTNAANSAAAAAANYLAAATANAATNAANNTAQSVQQGELAQLDQVLEQLGIPPSSIPTVPQLAMPLFRFDPQVLLQFINALQGITQQIGNQAPGNNAAAPAQQNNAAANNAAANIAPGQNGVFAAQFQELRLTFTAIGVELAGANTLAAASGGPGAGVAGRLMAPP